MKLIALLSVVISFVVLTLTFFITPTKVFAATSPNLGTAATYSITAGSSVTNVGATTISGNVGISPGGGDHQTTPALIL